MMSVATVDSLIRASSSSFSSRCTCRPRSCGQVAPQPGVVPQPADLGGWDERGPQHAPLVEPGQPHRIQLVGLGAARQVLDVAGVDQPHHQAAGFQQIQPGPPVVGGGLDHDPLDPLAGQLLGQLDDGVGGGRHLPHLGDAPARLGRVRHAGAHHPRRLGHVDRGDPRHDLLGLLDLDLSRCRRPGPPVCLLPSSGVGRGCPGARWGTGTLTGVLKATVRDPAVGPRRQTESRPQTTKDASASAGNPPRFSPPHGVPAGDTSTETKMPLRAGVAWRWVVMPPRWVPG